MLQLTSLPEEHTHTHTLSLSPEPTFRPEVSKKTTASFVEAEENRRNEMTTLQVCTLEKCTEKHGCQIYSVVLPDQKWYTGTGCSASMTG